MFGQSNLLITELKIQFNSTQMLNKLGLSSSADWLLAEGVVAGIARI